MTITAEGYQLLNEKLDEIQSTAGKAMTSADVTSCYADALCQEISALVYEARQIMQSNIILDGPDAA